MSPSDVAGLVARLRDREEIRRLFNLPGDPEADFYGEAAAALERLAAPITAQEVRAALDSEGLLTEDEAHAADFSGVALALSRLRGLA